MNYTIIDPEQLILDLRLKESVKNPYFWVGCLLLGTFLTMILVITGGT